mgnify:FL=1
MICSHGYATPAACIDCMDDDGLGAELPLTRSEAFAVVRHWQYHQFPGTPCPGIAEELEGQPETLVMRLLDEWAATNDRPPTGDEFRARLHRVTRAEAIDRHRANARARTKAS